MNLHITTDFKHPAVGLLLIFLAVKRLVIKQTLDWYIAEEV